MTIATEPSPAAFADFFRREYQEVVGFLTVATGQPGIAEDAAQEAFVRAFKRWDKVSQFDRPELWVRRAAINCATDVFRRRRREVELDATLLADLGDDVQRLWAEWQLSQLRPIERAMAILRYEYGHDTSTVGNLVGRSRETVRSYLQRLRRRGPTHERE